MSNHGQWQDGDGAWHQDRRGAIDRRALQGAESEQYKERRKLFRRKVDREVFERDHKAMIREALEDFAEEHGGQV